MPTRYGQDILNTLRVSDRPLLMREIVDLIAPGNHAAFNAIGNDLTHLYRDGRIAREKPGRWYAYSYQEPADRERVVLEVDRPLWADFQAECERRGYTTSRIVEQVVREQMEAWALVYKETGAS